MSIFIKTMTKLPDHCYECPCHDGESGYCQADEEHRYSDYRPFWCPLVETKEIGHCKNMEELISKQTVLDIISELNTVSFYEAQEDSKECYYEIRQAIKDLPPVKLQEPKTGHWIKTIGENGITSAVRCSECGFEDNRYMLFRYCPDCGARMVKPQERSEE